MGNLTLLQEEVLKMLKRIEYCVESVKLLDSKTFKENKFIEISYIDKDRPAFEAELTSMSHIEKYLQKNAIDFRLTYNFIDHPERPDGFIMLGRIYAKNLDDLEIKVQELIDKLKTEKIPQKNINITYNINIGRFIFNGKDTVLVDGKQKNVSDCLIEAGEYIKVSWDIINEKVTGNIGEILSDVEARIAKKSINSIVSKINKKTERYLEPEKALVDFKENEYWIQYKVIKDD